MSYKDTDGLYAVIDTQKGDIVIFGARASRRTVEPTATFWMISWLVSTGISASALDRLIMFTGMFPP